MHSLYYKCWFGVDLCNFIKSNMAFLNLYGFSLEDSSDNELVRNRGFLNKDYNISITGFIVSASTYLPPYEEMMSEEESE